MKYWILSILRMDNNNNSSNNTSMNVQVFKRMSNGLLMFMFGGFPVLRIILSVYFFCLHTLF